MKNIFVFLIGLLLSVHQVAQAQNATIAGNVVDQSNQPVPFANAILQTTADSSLVKAALTAEDGTFIIEDIQPGNYVLLLTQLGYKKHYLPVTATSGTVALKDLKMEGSVVNMKEATVEAIKPFIEHKADKTVLNVENSIVNSGSTALEILKRSPGVTVDNNDNISLRGKQGVLVMIDGKPTYLNATDLGTYLKNMQSDEVSQIEIITNPSAKYDASGNSGIINIKLRKNKNTGLNGSVNAGYGQGVYPDFSSGINLNYRNEKINAYGSYNYGLNYYYEKDHLIRKFPEDAYTSVFDQNTYDKANSQNHNSKIGLDYFLNSKNTIGFLAKGNFNNTDDRTTSTTEISKENENNVDSGYTTTTVNNSTWNNYSINLNHQLKIDSLGQELNTDIDFARYDNKSDFDFETDHYSAIPGYSPYTELEKNNQQANVTIRSLKSDYTKNLNNGMKLEAGIKSSYVITDNDVKYYTIKDNVDNLDTSKTNHFKYNENINAAYINWSGEFKKFSLQGGLRAEQTISKGEQFATSENFSHNYIQLFPSAFIRYKLNDKNQLGLNYSRRIDRPAYQQLNPFRFYLDPYTYQQGNPELQPQLTHSIELSHTWSDMINTAISYSHTTDAMTDVTKQIDSTKTTYVTTQNFESYDNLSVSVSVPFEIAKWWQTNNNFNVFNNSFIGVANEQKIENSKTTWLINTDNSFMLPKGWTAELSAYYHSSMVWATFYIDPQYSVSAGISKTLLNDRLKLKVSINDIFKTENVHATAKYDNVDLDFRQQQDTRYIRFNLTYNFGKKTIEQARRRLAGSTDEERRIKTSK